MAGAVAVAGAITDDPKRPGQPSRRTAGCLRHGGNPIPLHHRMRHAVEPQTAQKLPIPTSRPEEIRNAMAPATRRDVRNRNAIAPRTLSMTASE